MSDVKGDAAAALHKMKKTGKDHRRAAAGLLLLALVLLCSTGCQKEREDGLETLSLEENRTEAERTGTTEGENGESVSDGTDQDPEEVTPEIIFVYVCGAVQAPGVYELRNGSRVYEALALAGGICEDGVGESVNQARLLRDGEQLYIPTEDELERGDVISFPEETADGETEAEGTDGKVNINTASEKELCTLNGIGDTRAQSIVRYREENGDFQTIEDLMKVDGIKEGVFEKIKDKITVKTGS